MYTVKQFTITSVISDTADSNSMLSAKFKYRFLRESPRTVIVAMLPNMYPNENPKHYTQIIC